MSVLTVTCRSFQACCLESGQVAESNCQPVVYSKRRRLPYSERRVLVEQRHVRQKRPDVVPIALTSANALYEIENMALSNSCVAMPLPLSRDQRRRTSLLASGARNQHSLPTSGQTDVLAPTRKQRVGGLGTRDWPRAGRRALRTQARRNLDSSRREESERFCQSQQGVSACRVQTPPP